MKYVYLYVISVDVVTVVYIKISIHAIYINVCYIK